MPTEVSVAVAYSPEREKFLVLKRSNKMDLNPGKWNFPYGKIEDESPETAVLRELEEETDLVGEIIRNGESFVVDSSGKSFEVHPFLVLVDGDVELNVEHSDFDWIEASEIPELDAVDDLEKNLDALGVDF